MVIVFKQEKKTNIMRFLRKKTTSEKINTLTLAADAGLL